MITSLVVALSLVQISPARPDYIRMVTKTDGTFGMGAAAQRFVRDGKPDIWLVGAVHIGKASFYEKIQTLLNKQDVVLFEGVKEAPQPAAIKSDGTQSTPVYKILSDAVGLEFQQNHITYNHPGWKNVDLTWKELVALNKQMSGGKATQFDQVSEIMDPNSPKAKMLASVLEQATPGMKEAIKIMLVKVSASAEGIGLDPTTEKVIVTARNKAVTDEIAAELMSPTPAKSIAVLYGAKHLLDLQKSLTTQFGYTKAEKVWYEVATADPRKMDAMGKMMLDGLESQIKSLKKGG